MRDYPFTASDPALEDPAGFLFQGLTPYPAEELACGCNSDRPLDESCVLRCLELRQWAERSSGVNHQSPERVGAASGKAPIA